MASMLFVNTLIAALLLDPVKISVKLMSVVFLL